MTDTTNLVAIVHNSEIIKSTAAAFEIPINMFDDRYVALLEAQTSVVKDVLLKNLGYDTDGGYANSIQQLDEAYMKLAKSYSEGHTRGAEDIIKLTELAKTVPRSAMLSSEAAPSAGALNLG